MVATLPGLIANRCKQKGEVLYKGTHTEHTLHFFGTRKRKCCPVAMRLCTGTSLAIQKHLKTFQIALKQGYHSDDTPSIPCAGRAICISRPHIIVERKVFKVNFAMRHSCGHSVSAESLRQYSCMWTHLYGALPIIRYIHATPNVGTKAKRRQYNLYCKIL